MWEAISGGGTDGHPKFADMNSYSWETRGGGVPGLGRDCEVLCLQLSQLIQVTLDLL